MEKPKHKYLLVGLFFFLGLILVMGFTVQQGALEGQIKESPWPVTTVPVQLTRDSYGIAMVDSKAQTMWIYEFDMRGNSYERLRLIAARSFKFDRQLEEFNTGTPTPTQVKEMLDTMEKKRKEDALKEKIKVEELEKALEQ